jgi:hypothetical protein
MLNFKAVQQFCVEGRRAQTKNPYMAKPVPGSKRESVTFHIRSRSVIRTAVALKDRAGISQVRMRYQL